MICRHCGVEIRKGTEFIFEVWVEEYRGELYNSCDHHGNQLHAPLLVLDMEGLLQLERELR